MSGNGRRLAPQDKARAVACARALRQAGQTLATIEKVLGFSSVTIWRWCAAVPDPRPARSAARAAMAIDLRAQGMTQEQIATRLGMCVGTVRRMTGAMPRGTADVTGHGTQDEEAATGHG